ncbi:hypothetical protein HRJ45_04660 [Vibrio coralliilyticus]|uniref:hypothetical protein n=1 Tax=Vibrio coralliilyticus TaxID=190893 RepID=UPI0015611E3E|nr:hypothetical protein [Vibrio coralliilyticus]NRF27492.1 hypothetical protein [Vibrio coralliilyticus]NRF78387.1 hypothetical protein [Vibrio coralliilyticus]
MSGERNGSPPNRHWVALYTFVVLLPLVFFIPTWVQAQISEHPFVITLVSVGIIVPIVSYLALPMLIKLHIRVGSTKK